MICVICVFMPSAHMNASIIQLYQKICTFNCRAHYIELIKTDRDQREYWQK